MTYGAHPADRFQGRSFMHSVDNLPQAQTCGRFRSHEDLQISEDRSEQGRGSSQV